MAQTYEVLNARVKQKIDTEANWIAEEDNFGVIFEGEQAFVKNEAGMPVNFKIGDGTKKFSDLPYFIAYYTDVTSQKVLGFIGSENITIANQFRANTLLTDIVIYNSSGAIIPLKIGTSNGGSEVASLNVPNGANSVGLKYGFQDVETLYLTGLTGLQCAIFLLYIQLDENPAIPPSQAVAQKFPAGFTGVFREVPSLGITYNAVWDFTKGLARLGFGYDNCVIAGTNGTPGAPGAVSIPYGAGTPALGTPVGTAGNQVNITIANISPFTVSIPASENGTANGSMQKAAWSDNESKNQGSVQSASVGGGQKLSIQNYGFIDLWFQAIS